MSSLFNDLSDELFQILKGSGKQLTLYDNKGNRTFDPKLARRVFVEPDKMMVGVHEAGSDSEVTMNLSDTTDVNDVARLINTMRQITTRYNVLFNVRKYDRTLSPKDFAYQVEPVAEASMYGSTKTSYQRIGETRLVVRHARPVNADITGSRSRNILSLFVETKQGERFRFPVRHLSGARAFAQHLNQGGMPHDTMGQRIVELAQESSQLAQVSRYIQYARPNLNEDAGTLRSKLRERIAVIRSSLHSLSRPRGYKNMVESNSLNRPFALQEDDIRINVEAKRLAELLKIDSNHALAESLLPVALLNLGEIAMKNINEMFYEGLTVPADLLRELSETLASEYGYSEGADWTFVDKGGYNAIYFENKAAHTDACDLLENVMGCGFIAEDVQDKILQYATNWLAKRTAAIGGDAAPGKDPAKEAQELAAGIQAVLSGAAVAHPNDTAGGPSFADPAAELAYKLSLFLEPSAGMKNDALFNYLSTIVDKLQSGAKPTSTELLVAHTLAGQVSVGESIAEEEIFEASEDGIAKYATGWVQKRHGAVDADVGLNKREEEKDMEKAAAELADGLRQVFMGHPIAHAKYPAPNETPSFTTPNSQFAYELGLFLEPEAGLKNDALFTYISVLVAKLANDEKLTGPEKMIMDKILDSLDDSAHIGAEESIEEDSFDDHHADHSGSFDGFIEQFINEFNPAEMFAANYDDIANITPEDAEEYFVDATLRDQDVDNIKQTIGWWAQKCWSGSEEGEHLKDLTHQDEQHIIKAVWPKVVQYLESKGLKVAVEEATVNESLPRREFTFRSYLDDGVERDPVICTVEIDGEEHGVSDAIATITSVKHIESESELLDVLHPEQLERLQAEANEEAGIDMASHAADHADHLRDMSMGEDVQTAPPALGGHEFVATNFGPGKVLDSNGPTLTVELQNGDKIEIPADEVEMLESHMREHKELEAFFESFDPEAILMPVKLDEYQIDPNDTRLAVGDRVVHQAYGPGTVDSAEGKFVKVTFDRPNAHLPQDRTVSLSPGILYKVSQDGAAIRKEPEPEMQPGDKIRRKEPYVAPVAAKPGDKIRRKDWVPASESINEEIHNLLGNMCNQKTLDRIMQELGQYANRIIHNPSEFNLPDPNNLHYDDTDEEAYEFKRGFTDILKGKLDDLLDDAMHGLIEAEDLEELSKHYLMQYFDGAAQERGGLEKASDEGDEQASKKLAKRDRGLDNAWKKMHEAVNPMGEEMSETRLQNVPERGRAQEDFVNAVARRFGWAVTQQCEDIFNGDALEEQNGNALKYIAEIARERGEDELAAELEAFLSAEGPMDEAELVLPGDAGKEFIADVSHQPGEYGVYGKKFPTKMFDDEHSANQFVDENDDHKVLGVKDGKVHVAEVTDELEEALGMERILKLSGQRK